MSLLEKIKAITVRSLNARMLIAMVVILSSSFLVFNMVSNHMQTELLKPLFDRFDELQLRSAQEAYEENGKTALHLYLNRLDATFGGTHYLLDASGIDLYSGENRSNLLPPTREANGGSKPMRLGSLPTVPRMANTGLPLRGRLLQLASGPFCRTTLLFLAPPEFSAGWHGLASYCRFEESPRQSRVLVTEISLCVFRPGARMRSDSLAALSTKWPSGWKG